MGCTGSKGEEGGAKPANRKKNSKKVKMLLLGAGEAGKSTIAKQMKILHMKGFSDEEVAGYRKLVHMNVYTNIKCLVKGAEQLGIKLEHEDVANRVLASDEMTDGLLTAASAKDLKTLWYEDGGIKAAFARSAEIHLVESADYYFENLDRLLETNYQPSYEDILRSRRLTVGAEELHFTLDSYQFHVIDVGGQKGEREKWIDYFQNNDAVIFFVALSEYDQKLVEDNSTNRMHESLKLFTDVCNHQWFAEAAIILFLNKSDIFQEKIVKTPLTVAFPEYKGKNEFDPASKYIQSKFVERINSKSKRIYPFVTCATNTENFKNIFGSVKDMVISKAGQGVGMF